MSNLYKRYNKINKSGNKEKCKTRNTWIIKLNTKLENYKSGLGFPLLNSWKSLYIPLSGIITVIISNAAVLSHRTTKVAQLFYVMWNRIPGKSKATSRQ